MKVKELLEVLSSREADICVVDTDTGEHYLPCLCLFDDNEKELEYDDWEKWVLTLEVDKYNDRGSQLLVVKSPYNCDQTEYLLKCEGGEYETEEWYDKANADNDMSFEDRLKVVSKCV